MTAALAAGTDAEATAPVAATEPIEAGQRTDNTRALTPGPSETATAPVGRSPRRLGAALLAALTVVLLAGLAWSHRSGSATTPQSPPTRSTPTTLPPDLAHAINQLQKAVDR
jgi:hypothetical protein